MESSSLLLPAVTNDGSLLALVNSSRDVCVWDTSSGKQLCRVSNSHWSNVLSIAWSPDVKPSSRKKRRKSTVKETSNPLLAIGVNQGLVIWDVGCNEEQCAMPSDECGGVVSVSWASTSSMCVSDGTTQVYQWAIGTESLDRWKADKRGVSCICCHGDVILTAGRNIKLWDATNHSLIKRFSGHVGNVLSLLFVSPNHFLSFAENDRTLCLWNTETGSATSLVCEKEVWSIHADSGQTEKGKVRIVSVCQDGTLHLFTIESRNHVKSSDPLLPLTTIQFVNNKSEKTPTTLPVMSGHILPSTGDVMVAHTSPLRPVFETIPFEQPEDRVTLVRSSHKGLLISLDETSLDNSVSVKKQVTVVGPSNPRPLPWRQETKEEDLPMSDRLELLSLKEGFPTNDETKRQQPTAESLTVLVVQAVHSDDSKLLEDVLCVHNERLVESTVRKLTVTVIVPFLKKLIDMLHVRPSRGPFLIVWIRSILMNHTAYLITVPHLLDSLSVFYQSMDSRTSMFSRLARIQGKLDLLLAQSDEHNTGGELHLLTTPLNTLVAGEKDGNDEESDSVLSYEEEEEEEDEEDHNIMDTL